MPRFRATAAGPVQFNAQEELDRDAEEAAVAAAAPAVAAEVSRLAAIDATILGDTVLNSLKAMDNAAFSAWWIGLSAGQKDTALMRLTRLIVRRVA